MPQSPQMLESAPIPHLTTPYTPTPYTPPQASSFTPSHPPPQRAIRLVDCLCIKGCGLSNPT